MFFIYGSILTLLFFFITALLVTGNNKSTHNILSILLMVALAIGVTPFVFPDIADVTAFAFYAFGPLLLFYIREITGIKSSTKIWKSPHFIPYFTSLVLFPTCFLYKENQIIFHFYQWLYFIANFHVTIYLVYIVFSLKKSIQELKKRLSNTDRLYIKWSYLLLSLFLLYFVIIMPLALVLYYLNYEKVYNMLYEAIPILTMFYIFLLGVFSLKNPGIIILSNEMGKVKTLPVSKDDEIRFYKYMKDEKPYLDCDLTLSTLADSLGISEKSVTRIISLSNKENFYDFINAMRVEYYNKICRLEVNRNKTILDLALESGFYCKSTFNANYKRLTGQTPSQYRKGNFIK